MPFVDSTNIPDYEYPVGIQVMGWMVELYPLTFTILVGGWVVFDNYRKQLDISIVKYVHHVLSVNIFLQKRLHMFS